MRKGIAFESDKALEPADKLQEFISYHAIKASGDLAEKRGSYPTFDSSLWDQNIMPLNSIKNYEKEPRIDIPIPFSSEMNWQKLKK